MMAAGENIFSPTMPCQMPVLAQSQTCASCGTVWNGLNEVTVTANRMSDSEVASVGMDVVGAGAASLEGQFGERFLGTPNGRIYSRPWANGVGRSVPISNLTRVFGVYAFAASTTFDLQSLQDGDITGVQFGVNFGLGTISLLSPLFAIGSLNGLMINNVYPGSWQGYYQDFHLDPFNPLVITGGYDGLR